MRSFNISRVFDKHTRSVAAAVGLLLATLVPAIAPVFASADQATDRSVEMSSSAKSATGVSYKINFTAAHTAGAVVVQFCSNTPLIGEDCVSPATTPGGFTAASASAGGGATISGTPIANKVIVTKSITATTNSFTLGNITNPNAVGALYVRIATYVDATAAASYSTDGKTLGSKIDEGGVALYINEGVNVSGAVLETMTFCVSGGQDAAHPEINPITANCGGTLTAPSLKIGKDTAGVIALASDNVYTGTIYTQLSTNAAKGAVVSLKSSATGCGGLIRSSDPAKCDIGPAGNTTGVTAGNPLFGLKLGANISDPTDGDFRAAGAYDDTHYRLNFVDSSTGVTSTYGDPILDTNNKPANNRDMPITFGASISNNTPAGSYSADLSLIATGTF